MAAGMQRPGTQHPETRAGLQSLAIAFPDRKLDNGHWRKLHPELVAQAEQKIWMWKRPTNWDEGSRLFNEEMEPFLQDPFRGSRERRVLSPGATALDLEADAARQCLDATGVAAEDVDLLICSSFLPDSHGIGGATPLARELGLEGAAWNLESACSSALIAFQTASSLVATRQHRRVLVVTSCTYSRATREDDPIAWGIGDAATAMLVGECENAGILGFHTVHSADTNDAVAYHLEAGDDGKPWLRMRTGRHAAKLLRETSERFLLECAHGAADRAGMDLADVDHFIFNTPLAWYGAFCARVLGVPSEKTLSTYPLYANVGPCLMGTNLLHAAHWHNIQPGQTVLLYTVGSVSSCAAAIVRWGDVALGELPTDASLEHLRDLEARASLPLRVRAA